MTRLSTVVVCLCALAFSAAQAEQWESRHGACYDWEAAWDVKQEPSSDVWTGYIDFVQVGGDCARTTNKRLSFQVRAVTAGNDFFANRMAGSTVCYLHGQMRSEGIVGFELCAGWKQPLPFVLRFAPPRDER